MIPFQNYVKDANYKMAKYKILQKSLKFCLLITEGYISRESSSSGEFLTNCYLWSEWLLFNTNSAIFQLYETRTS